MRDIKEQELTIFKTFKSKLKFSQKCLKLAKKLYTVSKNFTKNFLDPVWIEKLSYLFAHIQIKQD